MVIDGLGITDSVRWKRDENDDWISDENLAVGEKGAANGFIFQRFWADLNGNEIIDDEDDLDYVANIENFILIGGQNDDLLIGGTGNDNIKGGAGDDTLIGNEGNDTLHGGRGSNRLAGGAGNDTFILQRVEGAHDTVLDFNVIDISAVAPAQEKLRIKLKGNEKKKYKEANDFGEELKALKLSVKEENGNTLIYHDFDKNGIFTDNELIMTLEGFTGLTENHLEVL